MKSFITKNNFLNKINYIKNTDKIVKKNSKNFSFVENIRKYINKILLIQKEEDILKKDNTEIKSKSTQIKRDQKMKNVESLYNSQEKL